MDHDTDHDPLAAPRADPQVPQELEVPRAPEARYLEPSTGLRVITAELAIDPAAAFEPSTPPELLDRRPVAEETSRVHSPAAELVELVERSRADLGRLLHRQGVKPEDAEDIVQDALLIVMENWKVIQDPRSYFLGTVRKLSLMHRRRLQGERQVRLKLGQVEPAGAAEIPQRQVDCQLDVEHLLDLLPAASRRIVELRYRGELSSGDVARVLHCSAAGVRQSVSRAVRRLRHLAAASAPR